MDEKMRILTMLQEGKVTAEEAEQLLNAMEETEPARTTELERKTDDMEYDRRMLRVYVDGSDKVRVNFPIRLAKKLLRATGKLPMSMNGVEGVDMSELMETIISCLDDEMLGEIVTVDSQDGTQVRIVIE